MFYLVTHKTNQIIRDDNGKPIITELNDSPEISAAIKKHGALWLETVPWKNTSSLRVHAELTSEDIEWLQAQDKQIPIHTINTVSKEAGGLFDFM